MDFDLIEKKYKEMSKKQRDLFFSEEIGIMLDSICASYGLTVEAGNLLSDEIGLVIMDINKQDTFGDNFSDSLHISEETAKKVIAEVKKTIFDTFLTDATTAVPENTSPTETNTDTKTDVLNAAEIQSDVHLSQIPEAPKDLKEKLELRPQTAVSPLATNEETVRPLTREEVLRSLAPTRTMTQDIASLQQRTVPPPPPQA